MKNLAYLFLTFCFSVGFTHFLRGQQDVSIQGLYVFADSVLGPPDVLVQGRMYPGTNTAAKGHPYLFHDDFAEASIYIKDLTFEHIPILIDLEQDQVIIRYPIDGVNRYIMLAESVVDSLRYHGRCFMSHESELHFPEIVYNGPTILLRQYEKRFIATYNDASPNGRYSRLERRYFVVVDGELLQIRKKKDLLELSSHPEKLRAELRSSKFRLKKATDEAWRSILMSIDHEN
ncbi:MAG: hypothetical protein RLP15_11265 [Cryomorphaceae bacterium]